MRRVMTMVIVVALVLGACSSADGGAGAKPGQPGEACSGLADRWIDIQQRLLEAIGEATPAEIASPSERLNAAFGVTATSVLEIDRDARRGGCESQVKSGSPLICARLNRLQAEGPAGENAIASLRTAC